MARLLTLIFLAVKDSLQPIPIGKEPAPDPPVAMMASTPDQRSVGIPGIGMTSAQEADAIVQGPALLVTLETNEIMANTTETNGTIETTETTGSTEKGSTEKETTVTTEKVVATTAIAMTGTAMTESVMTEIVMTENVMTETAEEATLAIAILVEARVRKALMEGRSSCI